MIINNDCLDELSKMERSSISCIVTDPPYGLSFMGKEWDNAVPLREYWIACWNVLKPGAFLLAFGGARTFHRLACAIEDAGFELRDTLMWIYGSGFPKSHNRFGIEGYGTALKPAYEPIIMAMKPCDGTFANNTEKWGQAGINIDGCRINSIPRTTHSDGNYKGGGNDLYQSGLKTGHFSQGGKGRWPANVLFDEEAAKMLDEQSGDSKSSVRPAIESVGNGNSWKMASRIPQERGHKDFGGASRFFYCAKTSSRERGEENKHPTVKPLKLMRYLITLVMPPKDGVLLDPFAGSGSTIVAAHQLGLKAIGIEKSAEYCEIARKRLENVRLLPFGKEPDLFDTKSA